MKNVIKNYFITLIIAAVAASLITPVFAFPAVSAHSCILMDADTGLVFYEQNADEKMLVASTTKILTAIIAIENCDMGETVKISEDSAGVEGSSMYLKAGDTYTVEQLLYGMMLVSGNDAAMALALHVAGSIEAFADLMNEKAAVLRMSNSSFKNPHGLDEEGHYSTAHDLSVLACYCMENDIFKRIVSTRSYTVGEQTFVNHNKLLWTCDGAIGLKTGYTQAAGRSLVSCVERNGERFVCVTLGDPDDWDDHTALYNWAFSSCSYVKVVSKDTVFSLPVISGASELVTVSPPEEVEIMLPEGAMPQISVELPRFVFAPIKVGEVAGTITVTLNGSIIGTYELLYSGNVELHKGIELTPWERFGRVWTMAGRYCGNSYYLTGDKR